MRVSLESKAGVPYETDQFKKNFCSSLSESRGKDKKVEKPLSLSERLRLEFGLDDGDESNKKSGKFCLSAIALLLFESSSNVALSNIS